MNLLHAQNDSFNPEEFRVKFRALLSVISFIAGMVFLCLACFSEVASKSEFTGPVVGFICGTMITLILTYYFGNADNQIPGTQITHKPVSILDYSENDDILKEEEDEV